MADTKTYNAEEMTLGDVIQLINTEGNNTGSVAKQINGISEKALRAVLKDAGFNFSNTGTKGWFYIADDDLEAEKLRLPLLKNDGKVITKPSNKQTSNKTNNKSIKQINKETINKENELLVKTMKKNLCTYFKNNTKTPTHLNMWTCYKADCKKLKGKGYTKGFVSHNARATNDYKHKESLAYVINRYLNPFKYKFFKSRGITVEQDMYALSELLQWIWRSQIRDGKPINLYIPSKRMRTILQQYLESDL